MGVTTLKGVSEYGHIGFQEGLAANIVDYFQWGFLQIGGFNNVRMATSGAYGGNTSKLRQVNDPNFPAYSVYEAFRGNWVYEGNNGVIPYHHQPINVSGVYVNSQFFAVGTSGQNSFSVDYLKGRIVFASGLPASSVVQAEYSYRTINIGGSDTPYFKQLQYNSLRIDDPSFTQPTSGNWSILSQNRVQLPAIIIETVPRRDFYGLQLGGGYLGKNDILFHIFAEFPNELRRIEDIICNQLGSTIYLFDRQLVAQSGRYPLNFDGTLNPLASGFNYPTLVQEQRDGGFLWKTCWFQKVTPQNGSVTPFLSTSIVRMQVQVEFPEM